MKDNKKLFEEFFITMMESKFQGKTSYIEMPDNNCFKFCLKECIYCLSKNENKERNIRDYSIAVFNNFYKFMQQDIIFKNVNDFEYRNLILKLKHYSENQSDETSKQKLAYFNRINNYYSKKYFKKCYLMLIDLYNSENDLDFNKLYFLENVFFNELLSLKMNFKYIGFSLELYKNEKFDNILDFIKFLYYHNRDNMEIYIPLKNYTDKDIEFLKKNQEIETINTNVYCKTYETRFVDFYSWVEKQIIRIESLFNALRFYTESELDFDLEKNIIIHSSYFDEILEVPFKNIISYSNKSVNFINMTTLMDSLEKLKQVDSELSLKDDTEEEMDRDENLENKEICETKRTSYQFSENRRILYYKILNILSFVEKDKDYLNHNSFIDNWSALETLCGLSGIKSGYEAVKYFIPKIIRSKIILKDLNDVFYRKAYPNNPKFRAQQFIDCVKDGTYEFDRIGNSFYQFKLKNYEKNFKTIKTFENYLKDIEELISYDIMRIYMIRNEYAHDSNLNVFNSMQQYKLKVIVPLVIDEFFKILNKHIGGYDTSEGLAFDVFSDILQRYNAQKGAFELIDKGLKIKNGGVDLKIDVKNYTITESDFMFNVLKNNNQPFKKYV